MELTSQSQFAGVPKQRMTRWHNPTSHVQRVKIDEGNGQPFVFEVAPGETCELDSRYDRAIHIRDCGRDDCRKKGAFCHAGHDGHVVGGGAPLLERVGAKDTKDLSLDPTAAARKEADERIAKEVEKQKVMAEAYERRQAELEAATRPNTPPQAHAAAANTNKK